MKVGIITIHAASNQGACLQAYALQEAITKLNCEAQIIDYHCVPAEEVDYTFNIHAIKSVRSFASQVVYCYRRFIRNKKFRKFREQYMKLSDSHYKVEEMDRLEPLYDCFCVGSDQVWNPMITDYDTAYLLEFVHDENKKVSYASSFGGAELDEKGMEIYQRGLRSFRKIAVREASGKKLVKNLVQREAEIVLDPTLLLGYNDWGRIERQVKVPQKYILIYQIRKSSNLSRYALEIAREKNMQVIKISDSYIPEKGIKHISGVSPREFIYLFSHATIVVTNSFHGTAFSVNFNKEFYVELSPEKKNGNPRIVDFLKLCDLNERIIEQGEIYSKHSEIDWKNVNTRLQDARNASINYLREALGV